MIYFQSKNTYNSFLMFKGFPNVNHIFLFIFFLAPIYYTLLWCIPNVGFVLNGFINKVEPQKNSNMYYEPQ
jgi:hypothetical protein